MLEIGELLVGGGEDDDDNVELPPCSGLSSTDVAELHDNWSAR